MDIGKYKQAMSYLLNQNATLKTFVINPEAKLIDNDPAPIYSYKDGGKVIIGRPGGIANPNQSYYGKWVELDENKLIDLYNKGITPFAISKQLGVSNKSISNRIEKLINENRLTDRIPSTHITRSELANKLNIQVPALEKAKAANTPLWQTIEKYLNVKNFGTSGEFYKNPNAEELRQIKNKSGDLGRSAPRNIYGGKESVIGKIRNMLNESQEPLTIKDIHKELLGITPTTAEDYDAGIKAAWNNLKNDKNYKNKIINVPEEERVLNFSKTMGNKIAPVINNVRDTFVRDPDATLEDVARNMYGKKFDKASLIEREEMARDASASIMKFLESVTTGRKVPGFKDIDPDKLGDIIQSIESRTSEFGVNANDIRNYRLNIADELRNFDPNTTSKLRGKIVGPGRNVDETVGLAATFKNAPGYLEATQFLKASTNAEKGKKIDKFFSPLLEKILEDKATKQEISDYNKKALSFKTKYPNVDVPFIKYGDKLSDVKKYVKNFDDFSDVSKKNILNIAKEKGIIIKTDSLPLPVLVDKHLEAIESKGLDRASKLKELNLSPKGYALNVDVIPGLGALSETQAAKVAGKLALGVSRTTGAPINAALGAILNASEMREKGLGRLDAALLGAGKGATQDVANFLTYVARTPEALYKTFKEDPNTQKVRYEQFLKNLGEEKYKFVDELADWYSNRINTKEYIDNLAQLEYEKELKKVMPAPSISETELFDTDQYLNEDLFKKKYREKLFKQFPEFKEEYNYVNKEPAITQKGVLNFNVEDLTQPQDLAKGGRVGYADGSGPKFTRRGMLGVLGAVAATPLVKSLTKGEKFLEESKVAKVAKRIPKAAGMPEWFPSLVARIEKEGKFLNKDIGLEDNLKIKELTIPSKTGKGGDEIYTMIQHSNGDIVIQANVKGGAFDAPFELHYRPPKSDIDVTTGKAINEPGEFNVMENRPRSTAASHHDADYEIDYDLVPHEQAISDIERVEKVATGKRIHPKRVEERTAARKYVEENPYDDIVNRYGDYNYKDVDYE
jgi:hypothetical protein